jgi:hypothetical protein
VLVLALMVAFWEPHVLCTQQLLHVLVLVLVQLQHADFCKPRARCTKQLQNKYTLSLNSGRELPAWQDAAQGRMQSNSTAHEHMCTT